MKNIAIIGAGITGLRLALELCGAHKLSLFDKSPSVGGRLATRRFGEVFVNHGASCFNGLECLTNDVYAERLKSELSLAGPATDLPKVMRDILLSHKNVSFHFQTKVSRIDKSTTLHLETGETSTFDKILITAPVPQAREILNELVLPHIIYTKQISFIGSRNNKPVKLSLSENDSAALFEERDESIRMFAESIFGSTEGLDIKKWRYSRVSNGHNQYFYEHTDNIILCGDAFDPQQKFHLGSAWRSGVMTARRVL